VASMIIEPPTFTVPNGLIVVPSPLNRRPCMTAFGTRFPPRFAYPSKVHTYKPLSMCTLQTCPSAAAPAVPGVPTAITATRQTNAQVKARALIMIFVNFVFIVVLSFCLSVVVLAFFDSSPEKSFLAVHLSTWQDLAVRYAESSGTFPDTTD